MRDEVLHFAQQRNGISRLNDRHYGAFGINEMRQTCKNKVDFVTMENCNEGHMPTLLLSVVHNCGSVDRNNIYQSLTRETS